MLLHLDLGLKSVTVLELKDIPLYLVHGLEALRDQLYTIKVNNQKSFQIIISYDSIFMEKL